MEFSIEQAKSIFDLLKSVSPYAMPLLISLIFPILWVLLKKVLGISKSVQQETSLSNLNFFEKIFEKTKRIFSSLNGQKGDIIVFYSCILLFMSGVILLKVGEKKEEELRQSALELKKYMEIHNYLSESYFGLLENGFNEQIIDKIRYNYPNEFVAYTAHEVDYIAIVDTTVVRNIKKFVFPFLDSYIHSQLQNKAEIYVDSLIIFEGYNLKTYFDEWMVYSYLSEQLNKEKYNLDVLNDRTVIRKIK